MQHSEAGSDVCQQRSGFVGILLIYLRLGMTAFGGPVAHLGYLREEFVVRRRWLDEHEFADLLALCQFLPGPASSQLGFAIGYRHAGLAGGLAAWLGFTLPAAILMMSFAAVLGVAGDLEQSGWISGLKAGAVAVVANAVWGMSGKLCVTRTTASMALGAAAVLILMPSSWVQLLVLAVGAVLGLLLIRTDDVGAVRAAPVLDWRKPLIFLGLFGALLLALPLIAGSGNAGAVAYFDAFYRSGALVFGGGHVVLPLLQAEVVAPGWVGNDEFLAGYGAAQAIPGPLFSFAAFLGYLLTDSPHGVTGGLLCLTAIFLPGMLLLLGVQPIWERLRGNLRARSAMAGTNAVVVGLLLAALYDPVFLDGIPDALALAIALGAFLLLQVWKKPAWLVILLCGVAGWAGYALSNLA